MALARAMASLIGAAVNAGVTAMFSTPEQGAAPDGETVQILVVEDDDALRRTLTAQLEARGYGVEAVADGRRAIAAVGKTLIENAVNHTPPGSTVSVSVRRAGASAILTVADDGPGIAADARGLALRRFGRLEGSRSQPGHGLGLPLVQAIAALHRGDVVLGDAGPGLVVRVTLPVVGV